MIKFKEGPAGGLILSLKAAPLFLRAVYNGKAWDALDQATDQPTKRESIFVYKRVSDVQMWHMKFSNSKENGYYASAEYEYLKDQPAESIMRYNGQWQQWCKEQEQ